MDVESATAIAPKLLRWYDRHARDLPWRIRPGNGNRADPYRIWLSEIMLQQTTVATVRERFETFIGRWPSLADLAAAPDAEILGAWAGLGYYARARNLIACARAVMNDHGGIFPADEKGLRTLPGIGPYTAAAIAAIAFGQRAVVVDGNIERVVSRLFRIPAPLPQARPEIYRLTDSITPDIRAGDFAQAMMDLASSICLPRRADCLLCPLAEECAAAWHDDPLAFPVKAPRRIRPIRHGTIWWIEEGGKVLLVRRPEKGLLGGMMALPGSEWRDGPGERDADVVHVFSHFELRLSIEPLSRREAEARAIAGQWWPMDRLDKAGLPSLYVKVKNRMEGRAPCT